MLFRMPSKLYNAGTESQLSPLKRGTGKSNCRSFTYCCKPQKEEQNKQQRHRWSPTFSTDCCTRAYNIVFARRISHARGHISLEKHSCTSWVATCTRVGGVSFWEAKRQKKKALPVENTPRTPFAVSNSRRPPENLEFKKVIESPWIQRQVA